MLYVGGVPFYGGGGGGSSEPALRQPSDGSTIDVGTIASGQSSVTKTITVKGKNLTQALTVAVTGTGYSVDKQSIPAADANVGTTLTITCTNTAESAAGTLSIASSEVSCDCDLVANSPVIVPLSAVKLTGSQWINTGVDVGPNTAIKLDIKFLNQYGASRDGYYLFSVTNSGFACNTDTVENPTNIHFWIQGVDYNYNYGSGLFTRSVVDYSNGSLSFIGHSFNVAAKTTISTGMRIGIGGSQSKILNLFHLEVYGLKVYENGSLTHDFIPVNHNGTVELYDQVNHTHHPSETSTPLEAVL